jgi:hypothetical protein
MGVILETDDEILGLEERRESLIVVDMKRKFPSEMPQMEPKFTISKVGGEDRYIWTGVGAEAHIYLDCGAAAEEKTRFICAALNKAAAPNPQLSEHIFAYQDGEIEVSKKYLLKLVEFFDKPENRKRLQPSKKAAKG